LGDLAFPRFASDPAAVFSAEEIIMKFSVFRRRTSSALRRRGFVKRKVPGLGGFLTLIFGSMDVGRHFTRGDDVLFIGRERDYWMATHGEPGADSVDLIEQLGIGIAFDCGARKINRAGLKRLLAWIEDRFD
jgi:hypothetical protein